jgi:hypothetical protein
MSNKSLLRIIYEQEHQPVCDRTWDRVKQRLGIKEPVPSDQKAETARRIRVYVYLRKRYPNRGISMITVQRFIDVKLFLAGKSFSQCTGVEIYNLVQQINPRPSDSTLYRWGDEIGLKFSKERVYVGDEVNQWVEKIVTNPRYKYCSSKLRRYSDNGQNQRAA